ncbi:hypothetical protein [Curtobacterium sp. ME12]|uniref:hypothetical protein n=1 Tax=Curtobacterium sp. ME12 TaxID=2744253 RepID=UPI0028702436|nr:hypothetical protein [Curtobacterium sp. ME12]
MAASRALAHAADLPLWQWIAEITGSTPRLPVPHFNVLNGGAHAANKLDFQEFMIAPVNASSMADAVCASPHSYKAQAISRSGPVNIVDFSASCGVYTKSLRACSEETSLPIVVVVKGSVATSSVEIRVPNSTVTSCTKATPFKAVPICRSVVTEFRENPDLAVVRILIELQIMP